MVDCRLRWMVPVSHSSPVSTSERGDQAQEGCFIRKHAGDFRALVQAWHMRRAFCWRWNWQRCQAGVS